jgi:two-component system chemotaxis sensor kinase CheA
MSDHNFPGDLPADEMGDYLRLYLDETDEQLDGLVETFLQLEHDPADAQGLNEAFRLIHSIKGSSALLGLDRITSLTHHLETHFERLRSGHRQLDTATINVVLRCIDFLRECNQLLRAGEPLHSAGELLDQVKALEHEADRRSTPRQPPATQRSATEPAAAPAAPETTSGAETAGDDNGPPPATADDNRPHWRVGVELRSGLPMAEMKAELIVTRLASLGAIIDCQPPRETFAETSRLEMLEVILATMATAADIEGAALADGVTAVFAEPVPSGSRAVTMETVAAVPASNSDDVEAEEHAELLHPTVQTGTTEAAQMRGDSTAARGPALVETVRVDVDRLDVLLNLTGELVVNRARLSQLANDVAPAFQKSGLGTNITMLIEQTRDLINQLATGQSKTTSLELQELTDLVNLVDNQLDGWDRNRQTFTELSAAIDQLTRVSNSLQRGVLNTRMVPVGPLFNRFKRSIRDITQELDKRVHLEIAGEKTELDKRMIDEIGDPLNHLIRNCVDHGIEPAEIRIRHGKPEVATVTLSASHRGNNVFITVADDGGGIDTQRVKQIAVSRGLLTAEAAEGLTEHDVVELIFQPGFSTAAKVSDISGRGVGMDIVRTKIARLNGTIEVASTPGQGTTFTIRLPLTLTITRCMLFRLRYGVLAVPIENVREIVSVAGHQSLMANGREMCDIRGEFLPLVSIDDLFDYSSLDVHATALAAGPSSQANTEAHVVILHGNNRSLGLRVDALLGGQDLVVKSLDENFSHIRGLGGASILGDGSVCLLLDAATCIELAGGGQAGIATEIATEA